MNASRSPIYGAMTNPSLVDFPGRMAAVMFTAGCNFRCGFCHNAALLGSVREGYTWDCLAGLCERFRRQWVTAVVVTGGEPTLAPTLVDTIQFFKTRGFQIKLDTNGSRPRVLREVLPLVDFVAMDIKCALKNYPAFVGFQDSAAIAESVALVRDSAVPSEFRTTIIEGVHTDDEMRCIGELIHGASNYAVQAFIPRDDLPDPALRVTARTSPGTLVRVADLMRPHARRVDIRGG